MRSDPQLRKHPVYKAVWYVRQAVVKYNVPYGLAIITVRQQFKMNCTPINQPKWITQSQVNKSRGPASLQAFSKNRSTCRIIEKLQRSVFTVNAGNTHDVDSSVTADTDTNWMLIRINYCSVHVVKLSTLCTGVIVYAQVYTYTVTQFPVIYFNMVHVIL